MTSAKTTDGKPAKRGMRRGTRKGYQAPIGNAKAIQKRKPTHTNLHGLVGRVAGLWAKIDAELARRNWNWVTLATEIPCSRQYLVDVTEKATIPAEFFYRLCQVLEWDSADLITRDE